jgi:hypothetical protein
MVMLHYGRRVVVCELALLNTIVKVVGRYMMGSVQMFHLAKA